jgi:methyl-accepting chemotaxis protein
MTRTLHHTLLLAALAAAPAALAQPATPAPAPPPAPRPATPAPAPRPATPAPAPAPEASADGLSQQDQDVLTAAEALAKEASQVIEQWIITQATTEDRVFSRLYFPVVKTDPLKLTTPDPLKFTTPYDTLADRDLVGPEDKTLSHSNQWQYAIITDINGYVPAHNTRFAQPLTGVTAQDYSNNRTKRMFGDLASFNAARNEKPFLRQSFRLETGDLIYDLSVPVMVRGKHWGCARIGYRRSE